MQEYEKNEQNISIESNETTIDKTEWQPDINSNNLDDFLNNGTESKLNTKWAVSKTIKFYRVIEFEIGDRIRSGKKIWNGRHIVNQRNQFELGLPLYKLIEFANRVYGETNWMNRIKESKIEKYECNYVKIDVIDDDNGNTNTVEVAKCTMVMSTKVQIILADGTVAESCGRACSNNLPRDLAFKKCKKESTNDGLKSCFGKLVALLLDYEEKVRSGYYNKYI